MFRVQTVSKPLWRIRKDKGWARCVYTLSKDDWTKATRGTNRPGDVLRVKHTGFDVLHDALLNKGVAFPLHERDRLGIRGLLPPRQDLDIEVQAARVEKRLKELPSDYVKFQSLMSLQDRNETLFYRVLVNNLKELAPIIYTPTVGLAAQQFGHLFRRPRGMYFSAIDQNCMKSMVYNWPRDDVQIAVITDGSRILGLGDLGLNGMAIPIGKLSLYSAIAGIHPSRTLPIIVDVGTNNKRLLLSPMYLGLRQKRLTGDAYFKVLDEVILALRTRWPGMLLQFEDFDNNTAIPVLERYKDTMLCFNDDIQGTGAVTVAGVLGALRSMGHDDPKAICDQKFVIVGAGTAGIGIADALVHAMKEQGMDEDEALKAFVLTDAKGSLGRQRQHFSAPQERFLSDAVNDGDSLLEAVRKTKPSVIIAVTGVKGLFTEDVVREMSRHHKHPIIFPLSNPTDHAECSAEAAYTWSDGRAIFASGSPFKPVVLSDGTVRTPNQANNMYTFPGIGLGSLICEAKHVTKGMLYAASMALAESVPQERLEKGLIFPDLADTRRITQSIAVKVCLAAQKDNMARSPLPQDEDILRSVVEHEVWEPEYGTVVPA